MTVKARTSAGYGPLTSNVTFTQEGGNFVAIVIDTHLIHIRILLEWGYSPLLCISIVGINQFICSCNPPSHFPIAPNTAPKNVSIDRFNATHMNVSWEQLTLEEARGFLTGYTITYDTTGSRRKRQAKVKVVAPDKSHAIIGGLELTESYYVIVSASTEIGPGISIVTTARCKLFSITCS